MAPPQRSRASVTAAGIAIVVLTLLIEACSSEAGVDSADTSLASDTTVAPVTTLTSAAEPVPSTEKVDTHPDGFGSLIRPILTGRCAICHNPGGPGSVHWSLEIAADVPPKAPLIRDLVELEIMPPWPAGPLSVDFHDDRSLRPQEIAAIIDWVERGSDLDVDPDTPMTADNGVLGLPSVDLEIHPPEPYDGSPEIVDDYRCLVYDPDVTERTWLTGYNFVPDQTEVVHHAIGYRLGAQSRERAASKDASDPGPGWQCYGSSGLGGDETFLAWAPGQGPTIYPEGTGLPLEAGDFIVVQIHYHFDVDAPGDRSSLQLDLSDGDEPLDAIAISQYVAPAELPCTRFESGPLCDRDAALARAVDRYGQQGVQADLFNRLCGVQPEDFAHMTGGKPSSSCLLPVYSFGEIVSVLGHEHELGDSFRMTLNPDSADEVVLLDIPEWDFEWQYNYYPAEQIELRPGDTIQIECSWDRGLRDPTLEPAYILWADGTNDEMCFSTVVVRERG